ncbi:amidohydrolase family protein [Nonomuraea sp. NPDC049486]|uniref:amidohydrolase family protein n=1 Tax=unclassified Nonomuraea TaxID=2593643 RepID=UPI0011CE50E2|nr:amidohydrolase family protein [Nonomuraea sp. C10]TXK39653.1 amidohydrolase family protein [Nonomuraea sp. C10]
MPKLIVDAHRLAGPVPFDDLPVDPRPDLDRLGIARALVTHTLSLYSDAEAGNDALFALGDPRLVPVPVVVPGVPGACAPATPDAVRAWGVGMVRLCPERHRFDLTGPVALRWLAALGAGAAPGPAVAVDLDETSTAQLRTLAERLPGLRILVLNPGYRRLRALAELMAEAPGVRVETGTVNTQGGVEWLAERFGAERLVFGTGAPVADDCGPRFLLDHLGLTPRETDLIAAGSLERLLGGRP